jgi:Agrobacterium tumefaciens protein Atu4866
MRNLRRQRVDATVLGAATILALAMGGGPQATVPTERFETAEPPADATSQTGAERYVGVWMSEDDTVRLDIAADGSYERSVAGRKRSARGVYRVSGTDLLLRDESGVRTTVTTGDHWLQMAGYRLTRI